MERFRFLFRIIIGLQNVIETLYTYIVIDPRRRRCRKTLKFIENQVRWKWYDNMMTIWKIKDRNVPLYCIQFAVIQIVLSSTFQVNNLLRPRLIINNCRQTRYRRYYVRSYFENGVYAAELFRACTKDGRVRLTKILVSGSRIGSPCDAMAFVCNYIYVSRVPVHRPTWRVKLMYQTSIGPAMSENIVIRALLRDM